MGARLVRARKVIQVVPVGDEEQLRPSLTGQHQFEIFSLSGNTCGPLQRAIVVRSPMSHRVFLEPVTGEWKPVPDSWFSKGKFKRASREDVTELFQLQCTTIMAKQRQKLSTKVSELEQKLEESESHRRDLAKKELENRLQKAKAKINTNEQSVLELQRHVADLESQLDSTLCKICFVNDLDALLQPCHHLVVCMSCAEGLRKCPVCRKTISKATQIYRT